jgi:tRNA (guanine-N1)-methyltransferase
MSMTRRRAAVPAWCSGPMCWRAAIDAVSPEGDTRPRLLMSPRGRPLTQARVRELADGPGAVIVCGRFEGVDQRVIEARNLEEISIGDYVLVGRRAGGADRCSTR